MRVADVIINYLGEMGVDTAFLVTGGQAMFLNDALSQSKRISAIFTHHEQAAGMAAEAYGRISGTPGLAMVTAGPGAVNVMNGVVGAWTDSSPMIILSGQSAFASVSYQKKTKIRQFGIQGIYIEPLVKNVTKYFKTIDDPNKALYYIQKAFFLATTGRPGPVWIDVPLDIQGKEVKFEDLKQFRIPKAKISENNIEHSIEQVVQLLKKAQRPLFLVGHGLRIANAVEDFQKLIEKVKIPVITSRLGIDSIESNHKLYIGRPGTYGERSANFSVQNADLIISIGSRMATAMIGHNAKDFGRNAKIIVVDVDKKELDKPGPAITLKVNSDAREFINLLTKKIQNVVLPDYSPWVLTCNTWKQKYPVVLSEYRKEDPINSYFFTERLSHLSHNDDVIVVDTGGCFHIVSQTWKIKKNQRFLTTGGISSMGYWVAGIGACMGMKKKRTIIITGDGSLQMNLQELATMKQTKLPIKLFIFNNNGYLLIRHTQKNFMNGRLFGEGPTSGLFIPDSIKIAKAYGIKSVKITKRTEIDSKIKEVLDYDGPVVCEIITQEWQLIIPRTASEKLKDGTMVSKSYEDMAPFLEKDELEKNMIAQHFGKSTGIKGKKYVDSE
jgi:acetolactate synthase-1/2/3 large subunit